MARKAVWAAVDAAQPVVPETTVATRIRAFGQPFDDVELDEDADAETPAPSAPAFNQRRQIAFASSVAMPVNRGRDAAQLQATDGAEPVARPTPAPPEIPEELLARMEGAFGADFSAVRVNQGAEAQALGARAYAQGIDLHFAPGEFDPDSVRGRELIGHELAHVVQQAEGRVPETASVNGAAINNDPALELEAAEGGGRAAGRLQRMAGNGPVRRMLAPPARRAPLVPVVQRYEAGEHTQFGDVYEVTKDDSTGGIAAKLGVKSTDLRDANKDKLKTWTTPDGRTVEGFNAGDVIIVPPSAAGGGVEVEPPADLLINSIPFTYGQVIALGDFFATPDAMHRAPVAELEELKRLLIKDAAAPGSVSTTEWNTATNGRYLTLLFSNASHFAPSDPTLVPVGAAATTSSGFGFGFDLGSMGNAVQPDHKSEWEKWHRQALDLAVAGDRERAIVSNAFGDHFLTDAFASGHLFNAPDLMEHFAGLLAGNQDAFFTAVANGAWANPGLAQFMSGFESTAFHGLAITNADRFRAVLTGINDVRPDVILQTIVNVVHDKLNTDGVEVANGLGSTWKLFGDKSLDPKGLEEGKRAVAQSQQNVLTTLSSTKEKPPDYAALNAAVWAHVPRPTAAGAMSIQQAVMALADPTLQSTIVAVVAELIANIRDIIAEVVLQGHLQPGGRF